MPKSKPTRTDRTKRNHRDPGPEREAQNLSRVSDGTIEAELDELDTDKYEPPPHREIGER
jgi:hypothetical protein